METIKGRCTNVVQADNRGTVMITQTDKEKKIVAQVAVSFTDPAEAAKYVHGKVYTVDIKEAK